MFLQAKNKSLEHTTFLLFISATTRNNIIFTFIFKQQS